MPVIVCWEFVYFVSLREVSYMPGALEWWVWVCEACEFISMRGFVHASKVVLFLWVCEFGDLIKSGYNPDHW